MSCRKHWKPISGCTGSYDASSINDIPVEVFYKELARYQPLVNNAKEAFADPKTGMAPGVMGLTAEDMQNFYSQLPKRLESVIWLEQRRKARL